MKIYGEFFSLSTNVELIFSNSCLVCSTSACCPTDAVPEEQRGILAKLHPEVVKRFYGCGSPIPNRLNGATVLDLGCGTGRDAYISSALVGREGRVIGIDMTPAQLEVARRLRDYHAKSLLGDNAESNVEFREGVIEDLAGAGVKDKSVDVVISNCVCNLTADKKVVWMEIERVLKDGGEFYFSDVYADRRLSVEARNDKVLVAECLGGALYLNDFRRTMREAGFPDIRVVTSAPIVVNDERLRKLVPDVTFVSVTIRAFKVDGLEDAREDFGQTATYKGDDDFTFDKEFTFPSGVAVPVDGNTALILQQSRYCDMFEVTERGGHRGPFNLNGNSYGLEAVVEKYTGTNMSNTNKSNGNSCGPTKTAKANGSTCVVESKPKTVVESGCGTNSCC